MEKQTNIPHTLEYVKNYILSYGCMLLDEDYKNNSIKLKIKCKGGAFN